MELIEISGSIHLKELQRYSISKLVKKPVVLLFIGIVVFVPPIATLLTGKTPNLLSPLFIGLMVFIVLPYFFKRTIARNYSSNRAQFENIYFTFNPEEVCIKADGMESKWGWSSFYKVTEDKEFLSLQQSKQVINIIPKRLFDSPDQINQVLDWAKVKRS